jgi:hypothetical protein
MENLEKFNPQNLMDSVREKIKMSFVGLIPDEEWDKLVKREIDAFFEPQTVKYSKKVEAYGYSTGTTLTAEASESPFRRLVWEHCNDLTVKILKEVITKEYFTDVWTPKEEDLKPKMVELILETAPQSMLNFFQKVMMDQTQDLRNKVYGN